jgi:RsmE family RNA methyltransferase
MTAAFGINSSGLLALPSTEVAAREGVVLACGPERGWTDAEQAMLHRARFATVHLGPQIFRTEIAVTVSSAIIAGRCGWLEDGFVQRRSRLLHQVDHPLGG